MKNARIFLFVYLLTPSVNAQMVEFSNSAATVKDLKTSEILRSTDNKPLKISNPALIEAPDQVPVLVIPISSSATLSAPNIPTDTAWARKQKGFRVELDNAMVDLLAIQEQVRRNEFENAKSGISQFNEKYPDSAIGLWLESNIMVVRGRKAEAVEKLNALLSKRPDFAPATKLLNQLKQEKGAQRD